MKAYIICFILTIIFTYLAQINFKKNYKTLGIIWSILAILVPTLIYRTKVIRSWTRYQYICSTDIRKGSDT